MLWKTIRQILANQRFIMGALCYMYEHGKIDTRFDTPHVHGEELCSQTENLLQVIDEVEKAHKMIVGDEDDIPEPVPPEIDTVGEWDVGGDEDESDDGENDIPF